MANKKMNGTDAMRHKLSTFQMLVHTDFEHLLIECATTCSCVARKKQIRDDIHAVSYEIEHWDARDLFRMGREFERAVAAAIANETKTQS